VVTGSPNLCAVFSRKLLVDSFIRVVGTISVRFLFSIVLDD